MKPQQCSGDDAQRLGEQHCTGGTRSGGKEEKTELSSPQVTVVTTSLQVTSTRVPCDG